MKKELKRRIEEYCNNTEYPYLEYFTDEYSFGSDEGYKYFFKYCNTNTITRRFKTQSEIEDFLNNI